MAYPPEPDPRRDPPGEWQADADDSPTEVYPTRPSDADTTVISRAVPADDPATPDSDQRERRFTAPGFDSKETQVIAAAAEPATEVIPTASAGGIPPGVPPKAAVPQAIPPRDAGKAERVRRFSWGWVLALILVMLALTAIAILGTVMLTHKKHPPVSQDEQVRQVIASFDAAMQTGDLSKLRSITCGATRDQYTEYDEHSWQDTYHRVAAAKQIPVIASVDQVVVNGQHAEANVTTYMAYDPALRSTRSIDLQFRDDQWKICQSPS